jgi:hypothetical protein
MDIFLGIPGNARWATSSIKVVFPHPLRLKIGNRMMVAKNGNKNASVQTQADKRRKDIPQ